MADAWEGDKNKREKMGSIRFLAVQGRTDDVLKYSKCDDKVDGPDLREIWGVKLRYEQEDIET